MRKLNMQKYMHNINNNAVQDHLSENYCNMKNYCTKYFRHNINNYYYITLCDSLFYIAGLCYQWLKSDILSSDLLRSGELLLLKVCVQWYQICKL